MQRWIGPKIETNALGDDFAAAKQHDPRVRCSLAPAFDHLFQNLLKTQRHLIAGAIMA